MLLVSLKEQSGTKEIILSLERWICDETTGLESQIADIMKDKEAFQSLVQGLDHFRSEKAVQQAITRYVMKLYRCFVSYDVAKDRVKFPLAADRDDPAPNQNDTIPIQKSILLYNC